MRPLFRTLKERADFCFRNGYATKAWTGGTGPRPWSDVEGFERVYVSALFAEQVADWIECWGNMPEMDTARIFWNRARHDAHATARS